MWPINTRRDALKLRGHPIYISVCPALDPFALSHIDFTFKALASSRAGTQVLAALHRYRDGT